MNPFLGWLLAAQAAATAHLHALLDAAPKQILKAGNFVVHSAADGWELETATPGLLTVLRPPPVVGHFGTISTPVFVLDHPPVRTIRGRQKHIYGELDTGLTPMR